MIAFGTRRYITGDTITLQIVSKTCIGDRWWDEEKENSAG
jgi:hypothetical protein